MNVSRSSLVAILAIFKKSSLNLFAEASWGLLRHHDIPCLCTWMIHLWIVISGQMVLITFMTNGLPSSVQLMGSSPLIIKDWKNANTSLSKLSRTPYLPLMTVPLQASSSVITLMGRCRKEPSKIRY